MTLWLCNECFRSSLTGMLQCAYRANIVYVFVLHPNTNIGLSRSIFLSLLQSLGPPPVIASAAAAECDALYAMRRRRDGSNSLSDSGNLGGLCAVYTWQLVMPHYRKVLTGSSVVF